MRGATAKRGTHGLRKRCPLCKKLRRFSAPELRAGKRCRGPQLITARKLVALGLAKYVWFHPPSFEYFVRTPEGAAAALAPRPDRPAWLHLDDWAGRSKQAVVIVGETTRSYRVTPAGTEQVKLGGRCRWLRPGNSAFVPKRAVTVRDP